MKIIKLKKGDDNMEHKDIWLVIGLTVILAVAVSVSTVSITGNTFLWGSYSKVTPSTAVSVNTKPVTYDGFKDIMNKATVHKLVVDAGQSIPCNDICPKTYCDTENPCPQINKCIFGEVIYFSDSNTLKPFVSGVELKSCSEPTKVLYARSDTSVELNCFCA